MRRGHLNTDEMRILHGMAAEMGGGKLEVAGMFLITDALCRRCRPRRWLRCRRG